MFWKLLSLLTVTIGFLSLVVWVYLPRNKQRLEEFAEIPMTDDDLPGVGHTRGNTP